MTNSFNSSYWHFLYFYVLKWVRKSFRKFRVYWAENLKITLSFLFILFFPTTGLHLFVQYFNVKQILKIFDYVKSLDLTVAWKYIMIVLVLQMLLVNIFCSFNWKKRRSWEIRKKKEKKRFKSWENFSLNIKYCKCSTSKLFFLLKFYVFGKICFCFHMLN